MTEPHHKEAIDAAHKALEAKGVFYDTANYGMHFMISHHGQRIDFWPTSGRWIHRGFRDRKGYGLDALLELLND